MSSQEKGEVRMNLTLNLSVKVPDIPQVVFG